MSNRSELQAAMDEIAEVDTLERARLRVRLIFELFYDDEQEDPSQAIRDAMTDLLHEAVARGVDVADTLKRAERMHRWEQIDWPTQEEPREG